MVRCRFDMKFCLLSAAVFIATCLPARGDYTFRGTVTDTSGAGIADAEVRILNRGGTELFTSRTDPQGNFVWRDASDGDVQLRVSAEGFATRETRVFVQRDSPGAKITLELGPVYTNVTVNATRGAPEEEITS